MIELYFAEMNSEKMSWVAFGLTETEARNSMRCRWNQHMRNLYGDNALTWSKWKKEYGQFPDEYYGMWVRKVKTGKGYIDDESESC